MRWIASNIRTFLLALILGIAVWVSAVSSSDPNEVLRYPKAVPIEIVGKDPLLVLTGDVPTTQDVTLRAPRSVWELLTSQDNIVRAFLDLSGLGAGEHTLDIQTQVNLRPVQIVLANPKTVTIHLESLENKTLPLTLSLSGQPAGGYQAGEPTAETKMVVISGPTSLVKEAVKARVVINLDSVRESIDESTPIEIINSNNEALHGLTLTPDTTKVNVAISLQGGFRDVAVKVVVVGQQAAGYRIENISVFPPVITIYSSDSNLVSSLPGVVDTQPLDLQDAKEDISTRLSLNLPDNVTLIGAQTVQVQVSISPIQTSVTLSNQQITVIGLSEGLSAQTFPQAVDVIVSGPLPELEVLQSEDITITINVTGLGEGSYQLQPDVHINESIGNVLVGSILPSTVEVVLSPSVTPTPAVTP